KIFVDLSLGEMARPSVVLGRLFGSGLGFALGFELFRRLKRPVGIAAVEQLLAVFAVDFCPLRLPIRTIWPADVGAFVPRKSEPLEGVEDHLLGCGDEAGAVGIFDAEDELAAALGGEEEVQQADIGCADVRVAGGRGGDADAGGTGGGGLVCHLASMPMLT